MRLQWGCVAVSSGGVKREILNKESGNVYSVQYPDGLTAEVSYKLLHRHLVK